MEKTKEKFTINNRVIQAKEIDFNFVCMLEVEGIELARMGKSFMNIIKVYVSYCMGVDSDVAGNEINQHMINGGNLNELTEILSKKMDESDFFHAMQKSSEEENPATEEKNTKKDKEVSE